VITVATATVWNEKSPEVPPPADVLALIWAMRGLVAAGEFAPDAWHRFLDIHLLGMRAGGSPSGAPSMSSRQPPR
jgi:hypothetical protein